jgi:uncharacterized damage-inducible protein DinB
MLDRILGHDHWATTQLLEKSRDLTDAQLDQPFDLGHGTLREALHHLVLVINFWTSQMLGQPVVTEREPRGSIADLIALHERYQATYADCARRMRDEQRLDETFFDHFDYPQSMGGTILHVYTHNTQHRAEVRHMLERLGVGDLWDYDPQEWEHATGLVSNVQRGEAEPDNP